MTSRARYQPSTLYKKTSTGKIQQWKIWTEENVIYTEYGQKDGKLQTTSETIKEGKNLGRTNSTTAVGQAILEAESAYLGKIKKGYVADIGTAAAGQVNEEVITGGFFPMLAKSYDDHVKKVTYPCIVQPKLDGIRCLSTKGVNNTYSLWTRTRKPIISVPHIPGVLWSSSQFAQLDGELYNHDLKNDFETIVHIVRQEKEPDPQHTMVQYWIYDIPSDKPFGQRMLDLLQLHAALRDNPYVRVVPGVMVHNEEELMNAYSDALDQGFEGAMIRDINAPYEYKRSASLLKLKTFQDAEFVITTLEEGKGRLAGHCGAFWCMDPQGGYPFKAKMAGDTKMLKHYWENKEQYAGKLLTVQFQGYTNLKGVPRFPVGVRIRDYE